MFDDFDTMIQSDEYFQAEYEDWLNDLRQKCEGDQQIFARMRQQEAVYFGEDDESDLPF